MSDSPNQHQHVGHVDAVNLTVSLCLCYTICIALVRLWIRRGAFGVDDLVVLVATVVTLSHTGSSYAALADGLGKPWIDIKASKDLAKLNAVCIVVALYSWSTLVLTGLAGINRWRRYIHRFTLYIQDWCSRVSEPHHQEQNTGSWLLCLLRVGGNVRRDECLDSHCRMLFAFRLLLGLL